LLVRRIRERRVLVVLILMLAGTIVWKLFSSHDATRLDAIRKKGYPVTLAELNAWYKPVPDKENNALIYEKVFALPGFGNFEDIDWPPRDRDLSVEAKKQLADLVATNGVALRLLHSAQTSKHCRYPVDLNKVLSKGGLPRRFQFIQGVKLLTDEALVDANKGDSQQAAQSFLAAGLLADSLAEEPLLISQIIRNACWRVIVRRLQHALALTQMTKEQLASLQAMVGQAERPQAFLRGLIGEQAFGICAFADAVGVLEDLQPPPSPKAIWKDRLLVGLLKSTGTFERDRRFYLDAIEKGVTAASLPFPERLKLGLQIPNFKAAPRYSMFTAKLLPRISDLFASEADVIAQLRAAQMALAVERFRCGHGGKLPTRLEELVPDYCKAVPADLFDGKQLRFRTFATGYVIYSIGNDGKDDEGAELDYNNSNAPHDITFKVEWCEPLSTLK